jgi:hypothetical protein
MNFPQNNDQKKTSLNFQNSQQGDIKRTNRTNMSKNTNQKQQQTINQFDNNHIFDHKPVSTINLSAEKQDKERFVKKVSKTRFSAPKSATNPITSTPNPTPNPIPNTDNLLPAFEIPPGTIQVPFPPMKTKYTEVLFESNMRDTDGSPIVYLPIDEVAPIVEQIINSKGYVEKNVDEYMKVNKITLEEIKEQITVPLHDQIFKYMQTIKTQNTVQQNELELLIRTTIQENFDKLSMTMNNINKDDVSKMIEDECRIFIGKAYDTYNSEFIELIEAKTKEYITKTEVIELIEAKTENFVTKTEVLELVDGKIFALNMEFLVAEYVKKMIEHGENDDENNKKDDDVPKTNFEEIIQPSVARIIHRVLKYDLAQQKDDVAEGGAAINFQVDDIYDFERQEKGLFTDIEAKGNIYNPMYSNEPTVYPVTAEDDIVEMGSVYNAHSSSIQYENELRQMKDRRWNRFGSGIENGSVIDLFLDKNNRKIYIVGNFKFVNRVPLENIAVYDLVEKKWKHVGEGIPQVATAIAVDEENEIVYVGGVFSKVGKGECEVRANNVAAYDVKQNKWYALGDGLNRDCSAILYDNKNKKLYVGGSFTQSGTKTLKYVAVYDIQNEEWQPLKGGSVNGPCRIVLKPTEDDLYLGGLFTHAGHEDIHVSYVAGYNIKTDTWNSLGGGLQGYCNAITYDNHKHKLYVGGTFTSVGTVESTINANHIAEFDIASNTWNDMDGGLNNIVQSIFYDGNNECIYVGGTFTHSFENNIQLNHIAKYDLKESKWKCLENHFPNKKTIKEDDGNDNVGINGICKVMSVDNKSLFIAGSFQIAGNITANSIVRYSLSP